MNYPVQGFMPGYPQMTYRTNLLDQGLLDKGFMPRMPGSPPLDYTMNTGGEIGFWDKALGFSKDGKFTNGWMAPAIQGAGALASSWIGYENVKLGRKQLAENQRQFDMNWEAQKNLTNADLRDRQMRRMAESSTAAPVNEYMAAYGVR